MMEKIKAYVASIRDALIYVAGPILVIGFAFFELLTKNRQLKAKLGESKAEKELAATLAKKEIIDEEANNSFSDYQRAKREHSEHSGDDMR